MNRKVIVIGAGAALLLGSVALAQDYSSKSTATPSASSADQNASNTSATAPSSSATDQSANSAASSGTDASATQQAGERG